MDQQKRYVTYIASTGASFPLNVPIGNMFDYSVESPYNTKNQSLSFRFRSMGFITFEDILKLKFNETTAIFNPEMAKILRYDMEDGNDELKAREDGTAIYRVDGCSYVKIPYFLAMSMDSEGFGSPFFSINHRAYPYINLRSNELEWWIAESEFNQKAANTYSPEEGD